MGNVTKGDEFTLFRSEQYNEKLYPKTTMVLEALQVGVSVLSVDSDSVFLQNPLPHLQRYSMYDIATIEGNVHSAGLYLSNPTRAALQLHSTMLRFQKKKFGSNQQILNHVIKNVMEDKLRIGRFNSLKFMGGRRYFTPSRYDGHSKPNCCSFAHDKCCPRSEALILHNDWVLPRRSGKIYYFKEQLMWGVDTNR